MNADRTDAAGLLGDRSPVFVTEPPEAPPAKRIVYVDMDGVPVDFQSGRDRVAEEVLDSYEGHADGIPGIFAFMDPMPGAVESFQELAEPFDTYILSTAPWAHPSAWADKVEWVRRHLGEVGYKRLILTHHKNLNRGDFLIDDRIKRGSDLFSGRLILFGSEEFPDWAAVMEQRRSECEKEPAPTAEEAVPAP